METGKKKIRALFLRDSKAIKNVFNSGKRLKCAGFSMMIAKSGSSESSAGNVIVGKKYGIAVHRNRAKRRFREILAMLWQEIRPGYHLIILPYRISEDKEFAALAGNLRDMLKKEGLLQS